MNQCTMKFAANICSTAWHTSPDSLVDLRTGMRRVSKEESDTPAENCLFNPTCFCLMDSLAGLPSGGGGDGGSGPACTPNY